MADSDYYWNLWHGCDRKSEGCLNCYVYSRDGKYSLDASRVYKTKSFDAPIKTDRRGDYKIPFGSTVYTCFTSDFFLDKADEWRETAWDMIRERGDLHFFMITKRIERFSVGLPSDWGDGWENVTVCCTCENQRRADERLPIYLAAPIKHKIIVCEPLLEPIDLRKYLTSDIEAVTVGGESGFSARPCNYAWVLDIREQCVAAGVSFRFHQTGSNFIKDERSFRIDKKFHRPQARAAEIDYEANK